MQIPGKAHGLCLNPRNMVLDLCPELYVGGKENHLWHPETEETQFRRWLAPKEAPKRGPVEVPKVPKPAPATTVAPAAFSSQRTQRTTAASYSYVVGHGPGRELSRTYATGRSVAGWQVPTCTS